MNYDFMRMQRGQVWFIRGIDKSHPQGREQAKDRPWLIVSSGKLEKSGHMITAVPCTTRDHAVSPAQVIYVNDKGIRNAILCEQIRTFDITQYNVTYTGYLSDDIMAKVDQALMFHLGLDANAVDLSLLFEQLESYIDRVVKLKAASLQPKFTDEDVLNFASKLQSLTDMFVDRETKEAEKQLDMQKQLLAQEATNYVDAQKKEPVTVATTQAITTTQTTTPKASAIVDTEDTASATSSKNDADVVKEKRARIRWTRETISAFYADATTRPMKEVMEKWNISKKQRFYSMKKYVADRLMKTTE